MNPLDTVRTRFEALTDGVMAIAMTLLAVELRVPHFANHASGLVSLQNVPEHLAGFGAFILSFMTIAIFWVNHHQLTQHISPVNGLSRRAVWCNTVLLLFVTLIPFATNTMSENAYNMTSMIIFTFMLFGASASFALLRSFIHHESLTRISAMNSLVGPVLYAIAIIALLFIPVVAHIILIIPPLFYFLPRSKW